MKMKAKGKWYNLISVRAKNKATAIKYLKRNFKKIHIYKWTAN